jgi:hypothetical protein
MRSPKQRLSFLALQLHYPTLAVTWVGGVILSALYLVGGITVTQLSMGVWGVLFALNIGIGLAFNQYLRRFNLVEHERRGVGLSGMLLDLVTAPVYVAAAAAQLAGRPLVYVVTAKGSAATGDSWRTFRPHLAWAGVALSSMALGLLLGHDYPALYVWASITALVCLAPLVQLAIRRLRGVDVQRLAQTLPTVSVPAHRRIGEVLVARGLITDAQLRDLLDLQATGDGAWERLGDLAVRQGVITADQLRAALILSEAEVHGVGPDFGAAPDRGPGVDDGTPPRHDVPVG